MFQKVGKMLTSWLLRVVVVVGVELVVVSLEVRVGVQADLQSWTKNTFHQDRIRSLLERVGTVQLEIQHYEVVKVVIVPHSEPRRRVVVVGGPDWRVLIQLEVRVGRGVGVLMQMEVRV
jgi:hypothetical protein